jgi:hypothetical protein
MDTIAISVVVAIAAGLPCYLLGRRAVHQEVDDKIDELRALNATLRRDVDMEFVACELQYCLRMAITALEQLDSGNEKTSGNAVEDALVRWYANWCGEFDPELNHKGLHDEIVRIEELAKSSKRFERILERGRARKDAELVEEGSDR